MARCWLLRLFRRNASHRPHEETSMPLSDLPPPPVVGTVSEDATGATISPPDAQAAAGAVAATIDQTLQRSPVMPTSSDPSTYVQHATQPPLLPTSIAVAPVSRSRHRRGQTQSFRVHDSWHYRNELRSLQPTQLNFSVSSRQDPPSQRPQDHPSPLRSHPSPNASQPATPQRAQETDFQSQWSDAAVQSRYKQRLIASTIPRNRNSIRALRSSTSPRSSSSSLRANWSATQHPPMPAREPPYPPRTSSLPVYTTRYATPYSTQVLAGRAPGLTTASPAFFPTASAIPNRPITSRAAAPQQSLPDPFDPSMWTTTPSRQVPMDTTTPSRQVSFNTTQPTPQLPSSRSSPRSPTVPLKSALRRRPGDVPAVLPVRSIATREDDDSDEMGYEGDGERNAR